MRAATTEDIVATDPIFPISVTFGVVQTLLYVDFAWVYWSRQRVKLRGGGVVDGEDLGRGWLIGKILGRGGNALESVDEEEGDAFLGQEEGVIRPAAPKHARSWGARGISVSADDGVVEGQSSGSKDLADPDAFEDDAGSDAVVVSPREAGSSDSEDAAGQHGAYGGGAEWQNQEEAFNDYSKY